MSGEKITQSKKGMSRRDLLRRGAVVGGTLVWAAPAAVRFAPNALAAYAACTDPAPTGQSETSPMVFTSPGAYSFQVPAGVTSITVEVWGGGGGGASSGSMNNGGAGGGGGGYARRTYTGLTPCTTYSGTVGAGGSAGKSVV